MGVLGTNTKLTPFDVLEIRKLRGEGWSQPQLAKHFKMSINQIGKICRGEAWMRVTDGQAVLTDGEAQLRQLTTPQPSKEEIEASAKRFQQMLSSVEQQERESTIPEQYQYTGTSTPEEYAQKMKDLVEKAERRRAASGPPPEPVPTRDAPIAMNRVAEQLLETLKDEHESQSQTNP